MIICLNGHPLSGKTTIANRLISIHGFTEVPLNRPFRDFVLSCIPYPKSSYNTMKDASLPDRGGNPATIRSLMIDVANVIEAYDPSVWARLAVDGIVHSPESKWSFDSIGKLSQWEFLVKTVGRDKLLLVQPYRDPEQMKMPVYPDGRDNIAAHEDKHRIHFISNTGDMDTLNKQVDAMVEIARAKKQ